MTRLRHEIPTHLNVEDRALFGLSLRQVMVLTCGASASYSLWSLWPDLATSIRIALAASCFVAAVLVALIRPAGRGIDTWAFIALGYLASPRSSVWRPRGTDASAQTSGRRWEELDTRVQWKGGRP